MDHNEIDDTNLSDEDHDHDHDHDRSPVRDEQQAFSEPKFQEPPLNWETFVPNPNPGIEGQFYSDAEEEYEEQTGPAEDDESKGPFSSKMYRNRRKVKFEKHKHAKKHEAEKILKRTSVPTGEHAFYDGKMYNEIINHDGIRYWQLADVSVDGQQAAAINPSDYRWRQGPNGLPLPIFNGAIIKCSRKSHSRKQEKEASRSKERAKKTSSKASRVASRINTAASKVSRVSTVASSAATSVSSSVASRTAANKANHRHKHHHHHDRATFDYFFDSNGEIFKITGEKLPYHWHLFSFKNEPLQWQDIRVESGKLTFTHDGKVINAFGYQERFKWMYIHPDGSVLDPGYEDHSSVVVFPPDGSIAKKLESNPIGSVFLSKFGKPILIVEDKLDIEGSGGNQILIYNEDNEYTDPEGNELKIGHYVLGADGSHIVYLQDMAADQEDISSIDAAQIRYSGYNVTLDKWTNIVSGNPIRLEKNGPPVLLIKYTTAHPQARMEKGHREKYFVEKTSYLPFWIIDTDGTLIVLHDKEGLMWDRYYRPYPPTGSGKEPNGDQFDYYIFIGKDRSECDSSLCLHPEILDSEDEEDFQSMMMGEKDGAHNLDLEQVKKIFKHYSSSSDHSSTSLFRCIAFPQCLVNGSPENCITSTELKMSVQPKVVDPKKHGDYEHHHHEHHHHDHHHHDHHHHDHHHDNLVLNHEVHKTLDIDRIKKLFKHHSNAHHTTDEKPLKSFQFPKCLRDAEYIKYMTSLCLDRNISFFKG